MPRSLLLSRFAVAVFAGAAGTAVATAGVLVLADQVTTDEKENSK